MLDSQATTRRASHTSGAAPMTESSRMNQATGFTKSYDELVELGLPVRLVLVYGKLQFMAGKNGECWPTQETLAKKCGLKSVRQVRRVVEELRRFKLIDWRRGRHCNRYRVLPPDVKWIAHLLAISDRTRMSDLTGHECPISDRTLMSYRKESSSKEESKRTSSPTPSPQPRQKPGAGAGAKPFLRKPSADDDERTTGLVDQTPEQILSARLKSRHGPRFDAAHCIAAIQRELKKGPGISLGEFVVYDGTQTTGRKFTNPNGLYIHLARELVSRGGAQPPEPPPGRCCECGGSGRLKDRAYCACSMGRDLARAERRPATKALRRMDNIKSLG